MRKIAVLCDQVIEAGWLLALIVAPLFFDVFSSRVFEPDKLGLLRTIATVMAVAWIVRTMEGGDTSASGQPATNEPAGLGGLWRRWRATPLALPTLALVLVYLLATACSVTPYASLWGSYQRLQGLYSTLTYIVVFGTALSILRRPDQLHRLLLAITLSSMAVAFYGLVQHYGLDPLPWGSDVTERVASNLGNPIFVAAYLIMAIPLTLAQALHAAHQALRPLAPRPRVALGALAAVAWLAQTAAWAVGGLGAGLAVSLALVIALLLYGLRRRQPLAPLALLGAHGWVLSVQLVCVVFAQSRGPVLGLAAGMAVFVWVLLLALRRRRAARAIAWIAVAGLALLGVLKGAEPLQQVRALPYLSRLTNVLDVEEGTGKVRVLIWQGATELIASDALRAAIGYGPESMFVAYNRFYPPDLAHYEERSASPDRSHNETYDALITTGVLGLAAYLALISGALETALRYLGLIGVPAARRRFWICLAVGLALGVAVPPLVDGSWRFLGLGIPAGILSGMAAYLALGVLGRERPEARPGTPSLPALLLAVGLLAAIVAHYVEIHMGIAIAATRLHFWLYLAVLAQLARGQLTLPEPAIAAAGAAHAADHRGARPASGRTATVQRRAGAGRDASAPESASFAWSLALVASAVLATLAWDYLVNPTGDGSALRVLWRSLTTLSARTGTTDLSLGLPALLFSVLCVSLLLIVAETETYARQTGQTWRLTSVIGSWGGALGIAGLYALIQAAALGPSGDLTRLILNYVVLLAAVGGALAGVLYRAHAGRALPGAGALWIVYPLLLVAAGVLIWTQNVAMIRADVYYKQGQRAEQQGGWDQAIVTYRQAEALQPQQAYYLLYLGRAQLERAKLEADAATREAIFTQTEATLLQAQQLEPLNTDHVANLARLFRTRAAMSSDAAQRQAYVERSSDYYRQAVALSPHSAGLYNEWAAVYLDAGQYARAEELLEYSLAIDGEFGQTYMVMGDGALVQLDYQAATDAYRQAVEYDPTLTAAWGRLAYACYQMGDLPQAIDAGLSLLQVAPDDFETLKNLAVIYRETGETALARQYGERALAVAPEASQASLQQFIAELDTTGE